MKGGAPLWRRDRARESVSEWSLGLQAQGLRDSALGSKLRGERVPEWLEKWVALLLEFVEEEQKLLPKQLCMLPPPAFYTPVAAQIEARGVHLCITFSSRSL